MNPTDVQAYALLEANALVEELMRLDNVTVSKKIDPSSLSDPFYAIFDSLISTAKCHGFVIHIEDSKRLADSLDAAVDAEDHSTCLPNRTFTICHPR